MKRIMAEVEALAVDIDLGFATPKEWINDLEVDVRRALEQHGAGLHGEVVSTLLDIAALAATVADRLTNETAPVRLAGAWEDATDAERQIFIMRHLDEVSAVSWGLAEAGAPIKGAIDEITEIFQHSDALRPDLALELVKAMGLAAAAEGSADLAHATDNPFKSVADIKAAQPGQFPVAPGDATPGQIAGVDKDRGAD